MTQPRARSGTRPVAPSASGTSDDREAGQNTAPRTSLERAQPPPWLRRSPPRAAAGLAPAGPPGNCRSVRDRSPSATPGLRASPRGEGCGAGPMCPRPADRPLGTWEGPGVQPLSSGCDLHRARGFLSRHFKATLSPQSLLTTTEDAGVPAPARAGRRWGEPAPGPGWTPAAAANLPSADGLIKRLVAKSVFLLNASTRGTRRLLRL